MKNLKIIFISALILELLNIAERKFFRSNGLNENSGNFSLLILLIACVLIFFTLKIIFKNYDFKTSLWKIFLFGIVLVLIEYTLNFIVQCVDFYILKNEIITENFHNVPNYMQNFIRRPHFNPFKDLFFDPIQILIWKIFENKDFIGFFRWIFANRISLIFTLTILVYTTFKKRDKKNYS